MGGYDIGGLFGALNLDDSQFSEALARAGGASRLFRIDTEKLQDTLVGLLSDLQKAGYSINNLAASLNDNIRSDQGLVDVLRDFASTLSLIQSRAKDLQGIKLIGSGELENYRSILAAEQLRTDKLKEEYRVMTDMVSLTARLRSAEDAGIKATIQGLEQERQYRVSAAETAAKAEQDYANLVRQMQAAVVSSERVAANERIELANQVASATQRAANEDIRLANQVAAATQRVANERVEIANQMAAAEQRVANERVALANKVAQGEAQAAAIEAAAANEVVNANRAIEQAERRRFEQHRQLNQLAGALTTVGLAAGAVGAAGVGGELLVAKEAATFQDAMAKSLTVIGDVSEALQSQLARAAREAAKDTGLAAKDIASDFAVMKKGGLDVAESMQLVGTFSKFAVANQVPLTDSTKQLLTVMEAFGLKASDLPRVADELTRGAQLSRSSVDQLATSLEGRAGSALKSVNVSLEESIALSIAFARRGYEASAAQTALSQIINRVTALAHTHGQVLLDVNGKMKSFHDIVYDSNGAVRPFVSTLQDLNAAFSGGSAEAIRKFFDEVKMGTTRGVDAVKAIVGVADEIKGLTVDVTASSATMTTAFGNQLKSPLVQLERFKRGIEDIQITLGIPLVSALQGIVAALKPVLDSLAGISQWFSELPEGMQAFAATSSIIGASALTASSAMLVMAGSALRLYGDLKLLNQSGVFGNLATGFGSIATKAGLAATAVAVVAAWSMWLYSKRKEQEAQTEKDLRAITDAPIKWPDELQWMNNRPGEATTVATPKKPSISSNPEEEAKARAAAARQQAALEEAQTALNKFADSYNSNYQLLTSQQRGFIEASFTSLNDILGHGVGESNLATFKAKLGQYAGSLREFTADAKEALEKTKLDESIANFSEHILVAGDKLPAALRANYQGWLDGIKQLVDAGLDPRLVAPKLKELEDQFNGSAGLAAKASRLFEQLPALVRESLGVNLADIKSANYEFGKLLNTLSAVDTLRKYGANQIADYVADKFQQKSLTSQLGVQDTGKSTRFLNLATELIGTNAPLLDKQKGLIAYFEEAAKEYGVTAEEIGQRSGIMIDGVVQDYSVLKDRVKSSLSAVQQTWRDILGDIQGSVTKFIGGLGGSLFDTLFPNFTNPQNSNTLQPLVDSLRSAFEQLSAYSDPKNALQNVISSIQQAGTAAKANAIAVKYFGTTAGPQLAAELRNGTISASDLAKAIDLASASTLEYGKTTTSTTSQITQLWRQLVKDVVVAIVEHLIILGINAILIALGLVDKGTKSLASAMEQVFTKLGIKLGVLFGKISADIIGTVKSTVAAVEKIINGMYAKATIVIQTIYETIGSPSNGGYDPGYDPGNLFNFGNFGNFGGSSGIDPYNPVDIFGNAYSAAARPVGAPRGAGSSVLMDAGLHVHGPITVIANSTSELVKQLKLRRIANSTA